MLIDLLICSEIDLSSFLSIYNILDCRKIINDKYNIFLSYSYLKDIKDDTAIFELRDKKYIVVFDTDVLMKPTLEKAKKMNPDLFIILFLASAKDSETEKLYLMASVLDREAINTNDINKLEELIFMCLEKLEEERNIEIEPMSLNLYHSLTVTYTQYLLMRIINNLSESMRLISRQLEIHASRIKMMETIIDKLSKSLSDTIEDQEKENDAQKTSKNSSLDNLYT